MMRHAIFALVTALVPTGPLLADVPKVVTDFTPVTSLVAMVMGDLGRPEQMLDNGADPHDFALRPSQMAHLAAADLVVWMGPELTPGLERAMGGGPGRQLALLRAKGTALQPFAATGGHDHGAAEDVDGDGDGDAGGDAHAHDDHGGTDPHAWLDPHNAAHWLGLIAAELAILDPESAERYHSNAKAAAARLQQMEAELSAQLAPVKDRPFVTFHDAFGYFAGHFGLTQAGSLALGDAAAPGAARVAALRDRIADERITCVFPEAGHDPALLTQIIDGTGARLGAPLDPEGLMLDPGAEAYEALMRGLAGALTDCLTP